MPPPDRPLIRNQEPVSNFDQTIYKGTRTKLLKEEAAGFHRYILNRESEIENSFQLYNLNN